MWLVACRLLHLSASLLPSTPTHPKELVDMICRYCDQEVLEGHLICQHHYERADEFRRAICIECGYNIRVDSELIRSRPKFNCVCGNSKFRLIQ